MLSLVSLLLTVGAALAARNPRLDSDLLPGWGGSDLPIPGPRRQGCPSGNLTVLDAQARIFLCQGFITDAEADHIREVSEKRLRRSNVVDTGTGGSKTSNIRTSYGVFLGRGEDPIIADIERRIAEWTLLPVENGEGLQVLRYELDQKYDAHHDYFFHEEGVANGGNRYATVLTYLADTEEGGETVFPNVAAPGGVNPGMSECAKYHLAARPKKGNAVLFHSIKPSGELERKSLHGACPVLKGTKWSAAKWIHVGKYAMNGEKPQRIEQTVNQVPRRTVPDGCEDLNDLCPEWTRAGECERNPSYMIGTRARPGQCVFSCNACDLVQDSGAREVYQINNSS